MAFRSEPIVKELTLLTAKRQLYLINGEESEVTPELTAKIKELERIMLWRTCQR